MRTALLRLMLSSTALCILLFASDAAARCGRHTGESALEKGFAHLASDNCAAAVRCFKVAESGPALRAQALYGRALCGANWSDAAAAASAFALLVEAHSLAGDDRKFRAVIAEEITSWAIRMSGDPMYPAERRCLYATIAQKIAASDAHRVDAAGAHKKQCGADAERAAHDRARAAEEARASKARKRAAKEAAERELRERAVRVVEERRRRAAHAAREARDRRAEEAEVERARRARAARRAAEAAADDYDDDDDDDDDDDEHGLSFIAGLGVGLGLSVGPYSGFNVTMPMHLGFELDASWRFSLSGNVIVLLGSDKSPDGDGIYAGTLAPMVGYRLSDNVVLDAFLGVSIRGPVCVLESDDVCFAESGNEISGAIGARVAATFSMWSVGGVLAVAGNIGLVGVAFLGVEL